MYIHIFFIYQQSYYETVIGQEKREGAKEVMFAFCIFFFFLKVLFLIWCLNSKIRKSNVMICLVLLRSFCDGERSYLMVTHLSSDCLALYCFANRNPIFSGLCVNIWLTAAETSFEDLKLSFDLHVSKLIGG